MSLLNSIKPNEVSANVLDYKYIIAGARKSGKTSLFYNLIKSEYDGDLSKGLLFAFERGYQALQGIHAVDISEWEDFQDYVEELVDGRDETTYEMIAIDTIDILISKATEYIIAKASIADKKRYKTINDVGGGWGIGHSMLQTEISSQINKLDHAGYALFFITHTKDREFIQKDGLKYDKKIISATGGAGEYFANSADMIAFIEVTKELVGGNKVDKRHIHFRSDGVIDAGSRFPQIVEKVEYSTENFVEAVEDAIKAEYGGDEKTVEEAKEKQAKEADKKEAEKKKEESVTAEDLIAEIDKQLKDVSRDDKVRLAELLKSDFGNANYKKYEDVDDLKKALKLVGKL